MNTQKINLLLLLMLVMLMSVPGARAASQHQSHDSIYWAAKSFLKQQLIQNGTEGASVNTGKLDSRLKLVRCDRNLSTFMPKGSRLMGKTTVGVKCEGKRPWSLNLPVTIEINRPVLVTTRHLTRGDIITADDVRLANRNLAKLPHGYVDNMESALGRVVKRRVMENKALTPSMIKKPQLVKRGQRVTILAVSGRMQVRMAGKALANGAAGDRIQVQNVSSSRKLEGIITSSGEIRVDI